jgi:hypothetical protein
MIIANLIKLQLILKVVEAGPDRKANPDGKADPDPSRGWS